ncbi:hypothetical protein HMPREF3293_01750 [Christensenella minuta]|uniref:Uncharacterized protein n=1 Tax=Christensenella minuta TaxID=626937 RepID=A0A136Q4R6_9FIRM|nr:hypothetical protein HMPREF3293_01750 [Christensenella minuta]
MRDAPCERERKNRGLLPSLHVKKEAAAGNSFLFCLQISTVLYFWEP